MSDAFQIIQELNNRKIRLWLEGDSLRFSAPKGALTKDLRERIHECKTEIINHLALTGTLPSGDTGITPIDRNQRIPASFAQQRLWFIHQLEGLSHTYNLPTVIHFRGALNFDAMQSALNRIVQRQESLRTAFLVHEGKPYVFISQFADFPLPIIDLSDIPTSNRELELRQVVEREASRPFDLSKPPLFRALLIKRAKDDHELVFTLHHIVSDGWSIGVFLTELAAFYNAIQQNQEAILPDLSIQYADFSAWQHKRLSETFLEGELAFWHDRLANAPELCTMPTDRTRLPIQSFNGASLPLQINGEKTQRYKRCAREAGTTLNTFLLSAFGSFVSRYSGMDDLVIGVPTANRLHRELEPLIGFFVNVLPIRFDLSGNPTFSELIVRMSHVSAEALSHSEVPFERLVEHLNLSRELSHTPLFQIAFTLLPPLGDLPEFQGLLTDLTPVQSNVAKNDLTLYLEETQNGLTGSFEYASDLYESHSVERWRENFLTFLDSVADNPNRPLAAIQIISEKEWHILEEWSGRDVPASEKPLFRLFEEQAKSSPEAPAVSFQGESLSYAELDRTANRFARLLKNSGVTPGCRVGICIEKSLDMVVAMLAILKTGAAYVPLDPSYPVERLQYMTENAALAAILTNNSAISLLSDFHKPNVHLLNMDVLRNQIHQLSCDPLDCNGDPESPAYIIYTSGSTGRPKGVVVPHRGVVNLVRSFEELFAITNQYRISQITSISFDASVCEIWPGLCHGAEIRLVPPELSMEPDRLRDWIVDNRITIHLSPTPLAEDLISMNWPKECALRMLVSGGDTLKIRPSSPLPFSFYNLYGPTENSVVSTSYLITDDDSRRPIPIGRPLSGVRCFVLDSNQRSLPIGAIGELYLGGIGLALGYWNDPEKTKNRFFLWNRSQNKNDSIRLYRTGDRVRYRSDGELEFIGRIDNQVKIRGFRIELGEIEATLIAHPSITQAIVDVREVTSGHRCLIAYIETDNPSSPLMLADIRDYLKNRLPSFMIPSDFIFLDKFPVTSSGKIDRIALPTPSRSVSASPTEPTLFPFDDTANHIRRIWSELLGVPISGMDDNFFDLGGHSLLLMQVRDKLKNEFNQEIHVVDLFRHPTIRSLSAFLSRNQIRSTPNNLLYQKQSPGDIAIIGMAGRFPGASNLHEFWDNLVNEVESISFFSPEELQAAGIPEEMISDPDYVPANGVLDDIDLFDAEFFNIPPREAEVLDPQQRILLEIAWQTLESAGYDAECCEKRIGVFAGVGMNAYFIENVLPNWDLVKKTGVFLTHLSNAVDFTATRISYKLNLRGPGISLNTACSTSLVAVHMASQSLFNGQCDMALAGGASIQPRQTTGYLHEEGSIESSDGHCRAFDVRSTGTVFGNGAGMVLLKRLEDAFRDGDTIYAVIKGSAVNNDGSDKVGFTAPSISGQREAIRSAYRTASIDPASIRYIEAHGTGTALGDPIEIQALKEAFDLSNDSKPFCAIGSVKTNVGHLDAAAGIAGLIKTVLSIHHGIIPASLHFLQANPAIPFEQSPFYVNSQTKSWDLNDPAQPTPRRAGVSAFGIGGTNAHVILQEAPIQVSKPSERPCQLLIVSARNAKALDRSCSSLASHLQINLDSDLADLAFTLAIGRHPFSHRRSLVCTNITEAIHRLKEPDSFPPVKVSENTGVVFMFTGQGSQRINMLRGLYEKESVFRHSADTCASILTPLLELDIREIIWPLTPSQESFEKLTSTRFAQPALVLLEYSLTQLWMNWGVKPAAMIGHSIGEWTAACLAGVYSLEDTLSLVALRGRLMDEQPPGDMLAVSISENELIPHLSGNLCLAAVNAPNQCVVSGPSSEVNILKQQLIDKGISNRQLNTSHAFHSTMMNPAIEPFADAVGKVKRSTPNIPFISNVTGTWITNEEAMNPLYWAKHLRTTVRFADGLSTLLSDETRCFLEVGPAAVLANLVRRHPFRKSDHLILASRGNDEKESFDHQNLFESAGILWEKGIAVDWDAFYRHEKRRRIPLPAYPFERKRYWIDAPIPHSSRIDSKPPHTPIGTVFSKEKIDKDHSQTHENAFQNESESIIAQAMSDVLGISPIARNDNFYQLGGDSLLAVQLISRLKRNYNLVLPQHALVQGTTPAQLATFLNPPPLHTLDADRLKDDCLVCFAKGTDDLPVIILIHAIGGGVFIYREFIQSLQMPNPIYALQAVGLWNDEPPLRRIEDIAERYLSSLQTIPSRSKRILIGHSFGGLVAYEMAQRLYIQGEEPIATVLIDSPGPGHMPCRLDSNAEFFAYFLDRDHPGQNYDDNLRVLTALSPAEQMDYTLKRIRQEWPNMGNLTREEFVRQVNVFHAHAEAMWSYKPQPYPGQIYFFKAREKDPINAATPEMAWIPLSQEGIHIIPTPGNHISMLSDPNVNDLTNKLRRILQTSA